jgi:hypothetical protein
MMASLQLPLLNAKDRELLLECLDFNKDGSIGRGDLSVLM